MTKHCIETLEARRLLSAGDVDLTFGTDGQIADPSLIRTFDNPAVIAAGGDQFFLVKTSALQRTDASGAVDASFGGANGATLVATLPEAAVTQPGGKIVVLGYSNNYADALLERLNPDGTRDTSFGTNGTVNLDQVVGPTVLFHDLAVQGNGKIILHRDPDGSGIRSILRLNQDGSLDHSFTTFSFNMASGLAMVVQADDKILLGGWLTDSGNQLQSNMTRLNANGGVDTTFGTNGFVSGFGYIGQAFFGVEDIALIPNGGGAFVAMHGGRWVSKYNANGQRDMNFETPGYDGMVYMNGLDGEHVHILPMSNGQFIAYSDSGMARINANGTLDDSFGRIKCGTMGLKFSGAAVTDLGAVFCAVVREPGALGSGVTYSGLTRLQASGSKPGAISVSGSTINIIGTEQADHITFPAVDSGIWVMFLGQLGRLIDPTGITLYSIQARGGDDIIDPRTSNIRMTVSGGDGDDQISGGFGNDSLSGNAGRDNIDGLRGNDRLAGNGGRDHIRGGDGNDILYGGAGGDWLNGGAHDDILKGEGGDDQLNGSGGLDTLAGGGGNDLFFAADTHPESLFGDGGNDSILARDGDDLLSSIENDAT